MVFSMREARAIGHRIFRGIINNPTISIFSFLVRAYKNLSIFNDVPSRSFDS